MAVTSLLHIGLPKTATTTLQNNVFARVDQVRYLGKTSNRFDDDRVGDLAVRIQAEDSLAYDYAAAAKIFDTLRLQQDKVRDRRPLLLSDEGLSAEGRADRRLIAERLHRLFAPAKVLIVLRSQPALVASFYLHFLKSSGERPMSFDAWLAMTYGEPRGAGIVRVGLDYDALVRTYEELFGADNVIVLAYEMIREGAAFAQAVGAFAGLSPDAVRAGFARSAENARMTERHRIALRLQALLPSGSNLALAGRRMLPQWLYQPVRRLVTGGRPVATPDMPLDWQARIAAVCAPGNDALARRKNLPLRAMGYPSAAAADDRAAAPVPAETAA